LTSNSLTMSEINRYINPLTDFGFKHFFGSEPNKGILLKFLNAVFEGKKQIVDVVFMPAQKNRDNGKSVLSELICKEKDETEFQVTIRRLDEEFFRNSSGKFSTGFFTEMESGKQGPEFLLKEMYVLILIDFTAGDTEDPYYREATFTKVNRKKNPAGRMGVKLLEIPAFQKAGNDLETELDKWFYLLKHLRHLEQIPSSLQGESFAKVFEAAEFAALSPEQKDLYSAGLKKRKSIFKIYNPDQAAEEAIQKEMEDGRLNKELEETFLEFFKKGYEAGFKEGMLEIAAELGGTH